jgi:hypothetical protein
MRLIKEDCINKLVGGEVSEEMVNNVFEENEVWELVEKLKAKVDRAPHMSRLEVLVFVSVLANIQACMIRRGNCEQAKDIAKLLAKVVQVLEGHEWDNIANCEVEKLKEIIQSDAKLDSSLTVPLLIILEEREDETNTGFNIITKKLKELTMQASKCLDTSQCRSKEEEAYKHIKVLKRSINVHEDIANLTEALNSLKTIAGDEKKENKEEGALDADTVLKLARSIKEITDKVPELSFTSECEVECLVCKQKFTYGRDLATDISGGLLMDRKFSNLKMNLRDHLKTKTHLKKATKDKEQEEQWAREEGRNKAVGLRIGRIVYHLVYNARPDVDLPIQIYLARKAGADLGDINHSANLVPKLVPHLALAVETRVKKLLGTRMVATGCLLIVNAMADKATHNRDTRQLVGVLTYNPGGESLFRAFFLGCPICPKGDGVYLEKNIESVLDNFIVNSQWGGFTGESSLTI